MRRQARLMLLCLATAIMAACGTRATSPGTTPVTPSLAASPGPTGQATVVPTPQPTATALSTSAAVITPTSEGQPTAIVQPQSPAGPPVYTLTEYPVPAGAHPHDVAPAPDGSVWYTAQAAGALGRLDPQTGQVEQFSLGPGSAPHGVIVGPDAAPWVTDGGLNAIVRWDPATQAVRTYPLPPGNRANLNTATFDQDGRLWFTGQNGLYGRLDPSSGQIYVYPAPRGRGPYGIATTPAGEVYFASLAGSYIGRIDLETGQAAVLEPPTAGQGARRLWPDSAGRLWVSEWNAGQVARYDPATGDWQEWRLPGDDPQPYAVYVDELDAVWVSDFGANALLRFDPATEAFQAYPLSQPAANVRQLLGRPGEVWGAESARDQLVVLRATPP